MSLAESKHQNKVQPQGSHKWWRRGRFDKTIPKSELAGRLGNSFAPGLFPPSRNVTIVTRKRHRFLFLDRKKRGKRAHSLAFVGLAKDPSRDIPSHGIQTAGATGGWCRLSETGQRKKEQGKKRKVGISARKKFPLQKAIRNTKYRVVSVVIIREVGDRKTHRRSERNDGLSKSTSATRGLTPKRVMVSNQSLASLARGPFPPLSTF